MNPSKKFSKLHETRPDVLIIGAGINGIGTFRDLALQGVNVLIIDRGDFCSGASAASSHMAHGGIRYLENGEFRLVREAVRERNRMIQNAPHLVRPLPTVIPIFKRFSGLLNAPLKFLNFLDKPAERGALVIKLGLTMYDAYTRSQGTVPKHVIKNRSQSLAKFPMLNPEVKFTATYYDGQILSPERYAVELLLDGLAEGGHAQAFNYVSMVRMDGDKVWLQNELEQEMVVVMPKVVINAAGPWIDFVNRKIGLQEKYIGGTKGSHLVLDHPELRKAIGEHEFFFENNDGRIVLIFPFFDKVIVGTSDIPIENPDEARCTPEEIQYFMTMISRVFPEIKVSPSHIVFRYSGVRPLGYMSAKQAGQIARDHSLKVDTAGDMPVFSLVGGKWTSYRAFSEEATDAVLAQLGRKRKEATRDLAIGGGRDYPVGQAAIEQWISQVAQNTGLDSNRVTVLFNKYGTGAGEMAGFIAGGTDEALKSHPGWTRREIEFLIKNEMAARLDDLILRRSSLAWLGEVTYPLLEELADIMADSLNWDFDRRNGELSRVLKLLKEIHGVVVV